jgi:hypothetical protein
VRPVSGCRTRHDDTIEELDEARWTLVDLDTYIARRG